MRPYHRPARAHLAAPGHSRQVPTCAATVNTRATRTLLSAMPMSCPPMLCPTSTNGRPANRLDAKRSTLSWSS